MRMGALRRGRHAEDVPGRDRHGTTRWGSHPVRPSIQSLRSPRRRVTRDADRESSSEKREITMRTIRRPGTVLSAFVAMFAFALVAPIAVNADDEVIAPEEPVLASAPAAPSWDETSGYGSVEASRAT